MVEISRRDLLVLLLLSAIWGSSFLFMRVAAPLFGPLFLIELRVGSALLVLLPIYLLRGKTAELRQHWLLIALIGVGNMAIPFTLFAFATLSVSAGLAAILNATVPFFTAIIAIAFFGQRLIGMTVIGLLVGFGGVALLVLDPSSLVAASGEYTAIGAGLLASTCYGICINIVSRKLVGVSGITITVGGLAASTLALLPLAIWQRPASWPGPEIWFSVLMLGVLCTGVAYLLFYKLLNRIGPQNAVMTTYLVPVFSIVWGFVFLAEPITLFMLLGGALVLVGVGLTTGKFQRLFKRQRQV